MTNDPFVLYPQDFMDRSPHAPKFKPQDPDELALLEFHTEEMTASGIVLLPHASIKPGQLNIVPKWRVIAVGDNVTEYAEGDLVIVGRYTGRLAYLDEVVFRMVKSWDVLAKVKMEPWKDFRGLFERIQREAEEKRQKGTGDFSVAE